MPAKMLSFLCLKNNNFSHSKNGVPFLVNSPFLSMIYLEVVILLLKEPTLIPIFRIFKSTQSRGGESI
jgi:hypothetical protein